MNRFIIVVICFLIMSCDLDEQASTDCNGLSFGSAYRDECSRCVEGDTGLIAGIDKDACGECLMFQAMAEIDWCKLKCN